MAGDLVGLTKPDQWMHCRRPAEQVGQAWWRHSRHLKSGCTWTVYAALMGHPPCPRAPLAPSCPTGMTLMHAQHAAKHGLRLNRPPSTAPAAANASSVIRQALEANSTPQLLPVQVLSWHISRRAGLYVDMSCLPYRGSLIYEHPTQVFYSTPMKKSEVKGNWCSSCYQDHRGDRIDLDGTSIRKVHIDFFLSTLLECACEVQAW